MSPCTPGSSQFGLLFPFRPEGMGVFHCSPLPPLHWLSHLPMTLKLHGFPCLYFLVCLMEMLIASTL